MALASHPLHHDRQNSCAAHSGLYDASLYEPGSVKQFEVFKHLVFVSTLDLKVLRGMVRRCLVDLEKQVAS
jgi:hypothetical protein